MTDETYTTLKDKVDSYVAYWKNRLWLNQWSIGTYHHRVPATDNSIMSITPNWRYLQAALHVNIWDIWDKELSDEEIQKCVVHELCHCLLDELNTVVPDDRQEWHDNHVERTTSTLTHVILDIHEGNNEGVIRRSVEYGW